MAVKPSNVIQVHWSLLEGSEKYKSPIKHNMSRYGSLMLHLKTLINQKFEFLSSNHENLPKAQHFSAQFFFIIFSAWLHSLPKPVLFKFFSYLAYLATSVYSILLETFYWLILGSLMTYMQSVSPTHSAVEHHWWNVKFSRVDLWT